MNRRLTIGITALGLAAFGALLMGQAARPPSQVFSARELADSAVSLQEADALVNHWRERRDTLELSLQTLTREYVEGPQGGDGLKAFNERRIGQVANLLMDAEANLQRVSADRVRHETRFTAMNRANTQLQSSLQR